MKLSEMFTHAVKHVAVHSLWMIPMAAVMMPSPALASSFVGSVDMVLTNSFNFFADGHFSALVENTLNGNFWDPSGSYQMFDGSMNMAEHAAGGHEAHQAADVAGGAASHAGHAGHVPVPAGEPVLSDEAKQILGF